MEESLSEVIQGRVVAVSLSERKGTCKRPVAEIELTADYGIDGDAHAGSERQVSLLSESSLKKMQKKGLEVGAGDFAENILISGIELHSLPVGSVLRIGETVTLHIIQIGKECHSECDIRHLTGSCVMPQEGVFAKVLRGGKATAGDKVLCVRPGYNVCQNEEKRLT